MNIQMVRDSIISSANISFSRSGGPGGQNVNKVNTKVLLSIDIEKTEGITSFEKDRIIGNLSGKLKDGTILSIFVDDERSQFRNREIAVERILRILVNANRVEKKRIATKPSKASKIARLSSKKVRSSLKQGRRTPPQDS